MNLSKLVLGTVQFGLDYGINNPDGQIKKADAFDILRYAKANGVDTLDTARAYGDSEEKIGEFIETTGGSFNLISKIPKVEDGKNISAYLAESLEKLKSSSLYAYLFHDFASYRSKPQLLEELKDLKNKGTIKKIGFSLYYPEELKRLISDDIEFDIIQVPYSVFDQRFEEFFPNLKAAGKEIHVRSVFLQGLVFKNPDDLEGNFDNIKERLITLSNISKESNIRISGLCLNFAVLNELIDKVVIGVDSLANLQENVADLSKSEIVRQRLADLKNLKINDEQIILPINWK